MKYQKLLKKLMCLSNHPQHQMSAILVKSGRVISCGYNKSKTHTKALNKYKMLHAELVCLIGLDYEQTKGCTAYVYRERHGGHLGLAKPCSTCAIALKLAGIRKVVYSDYDNTFKEERI